MKKILAALMSIIIITACINCGYAADNSAQSERKTENIELFFKTIPVITDEMTEDGVITRAEFAAILANVIQKTEMQTVSAYTDFEDVSSDDLYYQEICMVTGLQYLNGDKKQNGAVRFRPEQKIADIDAIESMIHLLQGTYIINLHKNRTEGIWDAADKLNLDISLNSKSDNAEWIKKLVFKALHAYAGDTYGISNGAIMAGVDENHTYIEKYWHLDKVEGIFSSNSLINIHGGKEVGANQIIIGDMQYTSYLVYENNAYIGQYVTAYVFNDGAREGEVCCMYPHEKYLPSVTVKGHDISNMKNFSSVIQETNRSRKKYSVSDTAGIFYNFEYQGPVRAADYNSDFIKAITEEIEKGQSCQIRLVENTGDNKYDFIWIQSFENHIVNSFSYNDGRIEDLYGEKLKVREAFDDNRMVLFDYENHLANASALQANDVISVFVTKNGDEIEKMYGYLSKEVVSGKIDAINSDYCTIDDDKYYISEQYLRKVNEGSSNTIELKSGVQTTFFVNVFDEIVGVSMNDYYEENVSYAFLIQAYYDKNTEEGEIKLLNENGDVIYQKYADKVTINDKKYKYEKILTALSDEPSQNDIYNIYRMAKITVRKGEIKKIELAYRDIRPDGASISRLYPDTILYSDGQNTDGTNIALSDIVYKNNTFGKRVGITTSTVIFDVPVRENGEQPVRDKKAYSVTSVSNMQDDCVLGLGGIKKAGASAGGAYMEFFDCDDTLFSSAAVRYYSYNSNTGGMAAPPEMQSDCIIVTDVTAQTINDDDEPVIIIEGYKAGNPVSFMTVPIIDELNLWQQFPTLTDNELGAHLETVQGVTVKPEDIAQTGILSGDVIQVTMNNKNEISNILINIRGGDADDAAWLMTNGNGSNTSILSAGAGHGNEYLGVNYGKIDVISNGKVVLKELDGKRRVYSIGTPTITCYSRKDKSAYKGSTADIETGKDMYVRQYYSQIKEIVVFDD